jgi:hypothetical protein
MTIEISRRDDIESIIYILIFCLKGSLPWKGMIQMDFLKMENAKEKLKAMRNPEGDLCEGVPSKSEPFSLNRNLDN